EKFSHGDTSELELLRRGRRADEGLADGLGENVVEIKMQLPDHADAVAALGIDRNLRLKPNLEIAADPDHARIDGAGGDEAVAEIVGGRCRHLELDDRDQVIDEIGQLQVQDL